MLRLRPADTEANDERTEHRPPGSRPARGGGQRRWPRAAAIVACAALAAATCAAQDEFTAQLKTVASIRFEGRHHVKAAQIRQALRTRSPSPWPWADRVPFREDFLAADTAAIRAVYHDQGFLDVRVESVTVVQHAGSREVGIVYHIHEGRLSRIRRVSFSGVEHCPESKLRDVLHARPGRAFNPSFVLVDTASIARIYRDRGYNPHVVALAARGQPDSLAIELLYVVNEGPEYKVGEVNAFGTGEVHVRPHLIRRELLLRPGSLFRISKVEESQQQLYETGLFSQVRITPQPDSTNRLMLFELNYVERKPRWFDAGAGSGTSERLRFVGDWGHRNLLGRGLQGTISGLLSLDGKGRFLRSRLEGSILEPWAFRTRTRAQPTIYSEQGKDRTNAAWVREYQARGFSVQLRRNLALRTRLYLVQDNTYVHQTFSFVDTVSQALQDSLNREVPPDYATHRITLGFERDARDNPVSPAVGSTQDLSVALAGGPLHGGAYLFDRLQGTVTWYGPVTGHHWTLALRGRAGILQPFGSAPAFTPDVGLDADVQRVPSDDRFRLGGVNSIRGYNENDVPASGGLAMLLANAELRIRVVGPVGLEAYVDGGNVWSRPAYIRPGHFSPRFSREPLDGGDVRYVVGIGPRLELPFGPLRLDFTWSLRPERLADGRRQWRVAEPQFAIGPSF